MPQLATKFSRKVTYKHKRVVERRVERAGFRVRVWKYEWDGKDRLIGCTTPDHQKWRYGYDAFGRRVFKVNLQSERVGKYGNIAGLGLRKGEPDHGAFYIEEKAPVVTGWKVEKDKSKLAQIGVSYIWDGDVLAADAPLRADDKPDLAAATCKKNFNFILSNRVNWIKRVIN